ncbi:MAG: succinate dehydrogenase cytochrome b subunit [Thermodesulfobacteriota bacterium]
MMNWLINTLGSSVGKKLMMSITGFVFILFLIGHLIGNLTIYVGPDAFNAYAGHLQSLKPALRLMESGLIFFAIVHIFTGLILFYQNFKARPNRYEVNKQAGGRTLGSATMPYTGLIILAFVIFHLFDFTFVDKTGRTVYDIVAASFSNPVYVFLYIASVFIVGIHVSHGFWSAFQTLGINHPKYMPTIQTAGLLFSLIVAIGFGFIPLFISLIS